jgi:hypothetical protein
MADGCQASTRINSEYPTLQEAIPAEYRQVFEKLVAAAKRNPSQGQRQDLPDGTQACASWDAGFSWVYCCVFSKAYMDDLRGREIPLSENRRVGENNYVLKTYIAA